MKTDDVLKALKQCVDGDGSCRCCPLEDELGCSAKILEYALETINRLKAENASLEAGRRADSESILSLNHELLRVKTESIKEFAEMLKNKLDIVGVHPTAEDEFIFKIDNLVKEMTGGPKCATQ